MNAKTIKDICREYGYSQTALAKRFGIPLRTVQNWHGGQREPAPYVVPMMEEILRAEKAGDVERENAVWMPHGYKWKCSACGRKINIDGTPEENGLHFCPGCGAKMDGEEGDA